MVIQMGMAARVMAEKELATTLISNHRMVPLALTTLQDDGALYTVFKNHIAIDLATLIGESGFDEKTAMFYTASVALALTVRVTPKASEPLDATAECISIASSCAWPSTTAAPVTTTEA